MNAQHPARRLRCALAVSLALGGMGVATPAAFGAPPACSAPAPGCPLWMAQAPGVPQEPMQQPMAMPQPVPGPKSEGSKSRGVFLAMFAQAAIPALVSGIDGWLRNKLNIPVQSGPGDAMQPGNMVGSLRVPDMPGIQGAPGMQPQPGPGGWSPAGQMAMPQAQGQWSGNPASPGLPQMNVQMAPPMPTPAMQPMPMQPSMPTAPGMNDDSSALQAGVAYQVSLVAGNGGQMLVDPAQRAFATGERISVAYRTNLPGFVEVYNIDSTGRQELIDQQQVSAGQLTTLGPYEFVNVKGEETLRIVLRPCVGGSPNSASRGMVRAQVNPELGNRLVGCEDPSLRQQQGLGTRGIAKVQVDGGTNYALDPVSRSEMESGRLAPREVRIRFLHQ